MVRVWSLGFGFQGSGLELWDFDIELRFGVEGLGFKVYIWFWILGFGGSGLGCWASGFRFWVLSFEFCFLG
jgi:hypothetical protein